MTTTRSRDLGRALEESLQQLEDNVRLYEQGRDAAYQGVAVQLRKLLLTGRRGLVDRALPGTTFHKLRESNAPTLPPVFSQRAEAAGFDLRTARVFNLDSRGSFRMGGIEGFSLQLDFVDECLTLGRWLNQWMLMPEITIERLISECANEEAAHTQDAIGEIIQRTNFWRISARGREMSLHHVALIAIGRYVHKRLSD